MVWAATLIIITQAMASIPNVSRRVTLEFDGTRTVEQAIFETTFVLNPEELAKLVSQAKASADWPVADSRKFKGKVETSLDIPANYLVQAMTMYEEIDLSTNTLELFQFYRGERIKLLQTRVATGRPGMGTPTGEFSIKRVTEKPWYYPPKEWGGDTRRVKPWPNPKNPYGRWMSEILKFSLEPAGYEFAPKGKLTANGVNQHSTNKSRSIGHYASHACVRIHPDVAARLFPFFLHFTPHREPKDVWRGKAVYPFQEGHLIYVKIYRSKIAKKSKKHRQTHQSRH
jgi:lipoprotein-anchoring transpeptidase ErfK/SrfK